MSKPVKPKKKIAFNPIEGQFDLVSDNNFSYESVPSPKKLTIPNNHQMIVHEEFDLEEGAELRLEGTLIMEE